MPGAYEKAITIQKAVDHIVCRRYLLPAIQRKFTWETDQICVLFDSIMRGYPISAFMFWEVRDESLKRNFRFYQFLEKYCERFAEDNPEFETASHGNFHAVIDGQQRLTSLYIGLKGTYAYRLPRKWWPESQDDNVLPPRRLYLNLAAPLDDEINEGMMKHEFEFLTKSEFERGTQEGKVWFLIGDVLALPEAGTPDEVVDIVMEHLGRIGQSGNAWARKALVRLYFVVRSEECIHYYAETSQSIDHVLDIFIRTNHGGTPLSYSDLLMSIAVANWKNDARRQIDGLVEQVRRNSGFVIGRDWILKAALMLTGANIRFKVENFAAGQVERIEQQWEDIRDCIQNTFRLIRSFGLTDATLRAKNAAIPIAYYLYRKGYESGRSGTRLHADINRLARHADERRLIASWLHMSLLKGVFGGQGDTLLAALRRIIDDHLDREGFPLPEIVEAFKGQSKDLRFDEEFIDRLLRTQKDDAGCYSILALLMPGMDLSRTLHKDHLHPASAFSAERLEHCDFVKNAADETRAFYEKPEYWNGILNLQLLDDSLNTSKRDQPLADWLAEAQVTRAQLLIPDDAPLDFERFPEFIALRRRKFMRRLAELAGADRPATSGVPVGQAPASSEV